MREGLDWKGWSIGGVEVWAAFKRDPTINFKQSLQSVDVTLVVSFVIAILTFENAFQHTTVPLKYVAVQQKWKPDSQTQHIVCWSVRTLNPVLFSDVIGNLHNNHISRPDRYPSRRYERPESLAFVAPVSVHTICRELLMPRPSCWRPEGAPQIVYKHTWSCRHCQKFMFLLSLDLSLPDFHLFKIHPGWPFQTLRNEYLISGVPVFCVFDVHERCLGDMWSWIVFGDCNKLFGFEIIMGLKIKYLNGK